MAHATNDSKGTIRFFIYLVGAALAYDVLSMLGWKALSLWLAILATATLGCIFSFRKNRPAFVMNRRGATALKEERARLMAAIDGLSLGFIFFDVNKKVVVANRAIEQILAVSGTNLTLDSIADRLGDTIDLDESCNRCLRTKSRVDLKDVEFEGKYLRVLVEPILAPVDMREALIGFIILIEDVTHQKILERTRDEFFAVASHELRTPLTVIRGNMAMLLKLFGRELSKNAEMKKMVESTHNASVGAIRMVNDFLNMASLEQGGLTFEKHKIDLKGLVTEILGELRPFAETKGLYLKFTDTAGAVTDGMGDRNHSKQVLFNIISNAINYTDKGGVTVDIRSHRSFVEVVVSDTGIGISLEARAKLFQKFQHSKEEAMVRDTTKGTGLGLYVSRLLAQGMGGELNLIESEVNKGSKFSFALPIVI